MNFATTFLGYNKKQVDEAFERLTNTIETLERNVEYLSQRCDTLEKQSKQEHNQKQKQQEWQIDPNVAMPIKKTLQQSGTNERFV